MSLTAFEQWWALWRSQHEHADAGECVIAVRDFYEARIAALQSERDALRAAVELVNKEILSRIDENKCPRCGQEKVLSATASGEPARKP